MGDLFVSWMESMPLEQHISFTKHFFLYYVFLFLNFEKAAPLKSFVDSDVNVIDFIISHKTTILIYFMNILKSEYKSVSKSKCLNTKTIILFNPFMLEFFFSQIC